MKPVLRANDIGIGHSSTAILEHLNFALYPGDFVCLMGSNGRGKTTLLRTLCGQLPLIRGTIELQQHSLHSLAASQLSRHMAVVLTERLDLPHMTVKEFVALGRAPHTGFWGSLRAEDWEAVDRALKDLQIEELAQRPFNQLSDGQKQMVLVARAVAQETAIILLDEPTNFLDMPHKMNLLSLLKKIATERRTAILFSSHDWDLVTEMCTLVWLVDLHGKLQVGMPEEIILWGDLSLAFETHHIHFSRELGRFVEPKNFTHHVKLMAEDPLHRQWIAHALAKEGVGIDADAKTVVTCKTNNQEYTINQTEQSLSSLYHLIWAIKKSEII